MIHRVTRRHAFGVALRHCLQGAAAVQRRKTVRLSKGVERIGQRWRAAGRQHDERDKDTATAHIIPPKLSPRARGNEK
jgi:hypothetical protein